MRYLVSAAEMKEYDRRTIEEIGIGADVLMERAALAAYERVEAHVKGLVFAEKTAFLLVGYGNNGGDGLALARLLAEEGFLVEVMCVGKEESASEGWKRQRKILEHYRIRYSTKPLCREYTIIVDALFGVGLKRKVEGIYARALDTFCELKGWKLALDLPSGIEPDTGEILGTAARVDETVTFGFCKRGLVLYPGCLYAGKVTTAKIGISETSFFGEEPEWFAYDEEPHALKPERDRTGNKGTFGRVLLIGGSLNMAGAAVLAAKACYRAGAGMVKVVTPEENRVIVQQCVPEALFSTGKSLGEDLKSWADAVVIGPGLGRDERAGGLLKQVLSDSTCPLVIDADGLNLVAAQAELRELLRKSAKTREKLVLTPHMGELARLTGEEMSALKKAPAVYAKKLASEFHGTVAAKDARTIICGAEGKVCVNLTGNSGLATAGSGDVLAGVIGGLLAQGMQGFEAAAVGVYLHGTAGDKAAANKGEHALMAGDIAEYL
jgi:NAD(P)H-hydrate epimerase